MVSIRVEPTKKMSDDEAFGRASTAPAPSVHQPPRAASPQPMPTPTPTPSRAPAPSARPYAAPEPSGSMPAIPGPRWGVIAIVLVVDLGLAIAGALMLQRGLRDPEPAAKPTAATKSTSATPGPAAPVATAPTYGELK